MRSRTIHPGVALVIALAALLAPGTARALPAAELVGCLGSTFGVLGHPNEGGLSATLGLLWRVEDTRWAFGIVGFADDLGAELGLLRDPNDPKTVLGTSELGHRQSLGAAWRLDYHFATKHAWKPVVSGTWGFARVADDHHGKRSGVVGSTGFGLAAGTRYGVGTHAAFGPVIRYQRLFNDHAGRYLSGGVEWSWQ